MSEAIAVPVRVYRSSAQAPRRHDEQGLRKLPAEPSQQQHDYSEPVDECEVQSPSTVMATAEKGPERASLDAEANNEVPSAAAAITVNDNDNANENKLLRAKMRELLEDMTRLKRQHQAELDSAHKKGQEIAVQSLVPILSALQQAHSQLLHTDDVLAQGMGMLSSQLFSSLQTLGFTKIADQDVAFDPHCHEAIAVQDGYEHTQEWVLSSVSPGFERDGKLVIPARVVVARPRNV